MIDDDSRADSELTVGELLARKDRMIDRQSRQLQSMNEKLRDMELEMAKSLPDLTPYLSVSADPYRLEYITIRPSRYDISMLDVLGAKGSLKEEIRHNVARTAAEIYLRGLYDKILQAAPK